MEDFVTFDIAKKLKDIGFECKHPFAMYKKNGIFHALFTFCGLLWKKYREYYDIEDFDEHDYICPTTLQVLEWLREEKNIYVGISYMPKIINETGISNDFYYPILQKIGLFEPTFFIGEDAIYDTYEEAALAGIEYCLNNLI